VLRSRPVPPTVRLHPARRLLPSPRPRPQRRLLPATRQLRPCPSLRSHLANRPRPPDLAGRLRLALPSPRRAHDRRSSRPALGGRALQGRPANQRRPARLETLTLPARLAARVARVPLWARHSKTSSQSSPSWSCCCLKETPPSARGRRTSSRRRGSSRPRQARATPKRPPAAPAGRPLVLDQAPSSHTVHRHRTPATAEVRGRRSVTRVGAEACR